MSDMKRVNPALMKAAAGLAKPDVPWCVYISPHDYSTHICVDMGREAGEEFNPLISDSDAWALERALKREGWQFRFQCGCYWARNDWRRGEGKYLDAIGDPSDTLLLLKCVSAMTSLPLYAEESMG